MKRLIAALLLAVLGACQHPARPEAENRGYAHRDALAEYGSGGVRPEHVAGILADLQTAREGGEEPGVGWTNDPTLATPEAVFIDPPRHPTHPARNVQLVIPSGPVRPGLGRPAEMNALFLLAAGEGLHPTMLLLHGLPGNERNLDLAQAVRRAGWNVLTFTYRGAWGSEGIFSIQHAIEDASSALAFLRSNEAFQRYQVDPNRIVLAGHSMGGMAALITTIRDPYSGREKCGRYPHGHEPIAGLILLDAWNAGAAAQRMRAGGEPRRAAFIAALDDLGHALGPITAADLADELVRRGEPWELEALARGQPGLCGDEPPAMPALTMYARHGLAGENRALAAAMREARAGRGGDVTEIELDTDHAFADARVRLAMEVVRWLDGLLAARRQ